MKKLPSPARKRGIATTRDEVVADPAFPCEGRGTAATRDEVVARPAFPYEGKGNRRNTG